MGGRNETYHPKERSLNQFLFFPNKAMYKEQTLQGAIFIEVIEKKPVPSQQTSILLRVSGKSDLIITVAGTK